MGLLRTSAYSAFENIVKLFAGVVLLKFVAISGGASDVALFGQFQNLFAIIVAIVGGAFTIGGVKFISESSSNTELIRKTINEMVVFIIPIILVIMIVNFFLADLISGFVFFNENYNNLLVYISPLIFMVAAFHIFVATLNGIGEIKKYVYAKLSFSIVLLVFSSISIFYYSFAYIVVIYIVSYSIAALFAYFLLSSRIAVPVSFRGFGLSKWIVSAKKFGGFWSISIVAGVATPLVMIYIRQILSVQFSIEYAGYWESVTRLSEVYLVIVTGAMLTYYIPAVSRAANEIEVKKTVYRMCFFSLSVAIPICTIIFFNRNLMIIYFLDESFMFIEKYFLISLFISSIKIVSWVFSYYVIAQGKPIISIVMEILFSVMLSISVDIFIKHFGFDGVFYAILLNSLLFLVASFLAFQFVLRKRFA